LIYLRNSTRKHRLNLRALEKKARTLLAAAGEPNSTLSLSFVGDAAMRRLNRESRGKDRTTDVLSFPLLEPLRSRTRGAGGLVPERMLGDVVICVDSAVRQAAEYDARLDAELARLMIHGVLHLLGHDHAERRERALMEREERRLALSIGLRWPYPGDDGGGEVPKS
jgi:probable rRNA maturation factor